MIDDASFELDNGSWIFTGGFGLEDIDSVTASDGVNSLMLPLIHGAIPPTQIARAESTAFDLLEDQPLRIAVWREADLHQSIKLYLSLKISAIEIATLRESDLPAETWTEFSYILPTTGMADQFMAETFWTGGALTVAAGTWRVDNLRLGVVSLAVKLAERAINAVVAILQAQLVTELGLIDANRADGITLTVPVAGDYWKRPKSEIAGSEVQVCVYESAFDFENPYIDADSQRAAYAIPVVVRLVLFNVRAETADVMLTRIRRYGTGVFNVINKSPTLGGADPALKICVAQRVVPSWDIDSDKDQVGKGSVEIPLVVHCEETQA